MAEIRINATGGLKLYDADDSHYAQIVAGTISSNVDALTLGSSSADFNIPVKVLGTTPTLTIGDAGAEDTKIVFDGNAQDFYIALDDSADDLLIGLGSTVGTTPAISIDENLKVTTYGDIVMTGTTPTLTIGDAGAEDTAIVFDGNAQDFYVGLDDSADDLVIGLGSSVGTTPAISINSDRDVTISDGAIDFDIASHDTSNGLKLGGTLVTATAAELNIMDGVTSTAAEINLIDGGTARGTTALADGDGILINDAGTMRMTNVTTVKTYMAGGITEFDEWILTTFLTGDGTPIDGNLSRSAHTGFALLGTGMSESSGIFTFPSTGYWWVNYNGIGRTYDAADRTTLQIHATTDDSTYSNISNITLGIGAYSGNVGDTNSYAGGGTSAMLDVTNTSNVKVRFHVVQENTSNSLVGSAVPHTYMQFMKLADT